MCIIDKIRIIQLCNIFILYLRMVERYIKPTDSIYFQQKLYVINIPLHLVVSSCSYFYITVDERYNMKEWEKLAAKR